MNPHIPHHKVVLIPRASILSDSEVSITVLFLLFSPYYTAVRISNCSKSTYVIKVATMKNMIVPHAPFETEVSISLLCQLFSTCYIAV